MLSPSAWPSLPSVPAPGGPRQPPAEHSLDDANYDAHAVAGQQFSSAPATSLKGEGNGNAPPASTSEGCNLEQQQSVAAPTGGDGQTTRCKFDRLVSQVFAADEAAGPQSGSASASRGDGPARLGSAARRWQARLSSSYVRRAVSARFFGRAAVGTGDDGHGDKAASAAGATPGKSGEPGTGLCGSAEPCGCEACCRSACWGLQWGATLSGTCSEL